MNKKQKQQQTASNEVYTPVLSVDDSMTTEERLTDNAVSNILPARYLINGETPDEMFRRVANNVATAEHLHSDEDTAGEAFTEWSEEFYDLMSSLRFMPNSPTLMNAGGDLQQLSACFVLEVGDSMAEPDEMGRESILDSAKHAGQIFKSGGGVGYTFGFLRPKGTYIQSTDSETSGPMQFMNLFDEVCNTVKQGGKRRGAQMAIMPVTHPDIGRFIVSKRKEGAYSNFNISVGVTDEFVEAVREDGLYELKDPRSNHEDTFEIVQATKNFFAVSKADSPKAVVDENVWRDHADDLEAWDWENGETVSFRDKWQAHFQAAEKSGTLDVGEEMALPARFIWDMMIDGAWRNGEPGLFYLDETNREHTFDTDLHPEYEIHATNPSLVAGTPVLTNDGVVPIEELEDSTFKTRSLNKNWAEASCWKSGEDEELYKIETNTGYTYEATPQHEWPVVSDGSISKKRSDELANGDRIPLTETDSLEYGEDGEYGDGLLVGWLYGDGSITAPTEENGDDFQYEFAVSEADKSAGILDFITNKLAEITGTQQSPTKRNRGGENRYEIHVSNQSIVEYMERFGVTQKHSGIPDAIWSTASEAFRKGFIDGLFSAVGSVSTSKERLTLTTPRSQIAEDVVSLLSFYGIKAQRGERVHDVTISDTAALRFRELFRLSHDYKESSLEELSGKSYANHKYSSVKVTSVEKSGRTADVWDISVLDSSHTFPIAGITTGNCAEQPLNNYEACNLGHINLSLMVQEGVENFSEWQEKQDYDYDRTESEVVDYLNESIDYDELDRVIEGGTRFLDNVVDMSEFPLEQIEDTVSEMRKIGLGVMGWAQMLYQLGIPYGSEASYVAAKHVMSYIDARATRNSHELALQRGSFPAWEDSKYADPTEYKEWFKAHAHVDSREHAKGYEMRNHNVTTVAPTGTTSMIADTSGGIEPVYNVAYKKNVGNDIQGADKLVEFDSYFVRALEANNVSVTDVKQEAAEKMDSNDFDSVQDLETVPEALKDVFITTNDLSSRQHGLMQRAFQHAVDSGISKTVNLPNDATHDDIHEAYMLALSDEELGEAIKGLTVYRDGSRETQVLSTGEETKAALEEAKKKLEQAGVDVGEIDE